MPRQRSLLKPPCRNSSRDVSSSRKRSALKLFKTIQRSTTQIVYYFCQLEAQLQVELQHMHAQITIDAREDDRN
jgi:hypothetical protein